MRTGDYKETTVQLVALKTTSLVTPKTSTTVLKIRTLDPSLLCR